MLIFRYFLIEFRLFRCMKATNHKELGKKYLNDQHYGRALIEKVRDSKFTQGRVAEIKLNGATSQIRELG